MAAVASIKVETPKNLDSIFSLESFKYLEMKGLFKNIYDYLQVFGNKIEEMETKVDGIDIPDFSKLLAQIEALEKSNKDLVQTDKELRQEIEKIRGANDDSHKDFQEQIDKLKETSDGHETRIAKLEEVVKELQDRPVQEGNVEIDYSKLCNKQDYLELLERVAMVEKRNIEQDDRLTNNDERIQKLE